MATFELEVSRKLHTVVRGLSSKWGTGIVPTTERILMRGLLVEYEEGNVPAELLGTVRGTSLPPPGYVAPEVKVDPDVVEVEAQAVEVEEPEFEEREWWIAGPTTCPGIVVIGEGTNLWIRQTHADVAYVLVMDNKITEGKPLKGTQATCVQDQDAAKVVAWAESESAKQAAPPDVGRIWRYPELIPGGYPLAYGEWAFVVNKGRHYEVMVYDEDGVLVTSSNLTQEVIDAFDLQGKVKKYTEVPLAFNVPTRVEFPSHKPFFVRDIHPSEPYPDKDRQECQIEVRDALRALKSFPPVMTEAMIANGNCTGDEGKIIFKCGGQRFGVRGDRVFRVNETQGSNALDSRNILHPQDAQLILAAHAEDAAKWEAWGSKPPRMLRQRVGEGYFNRNPFWLWIEPALDAWRVEFDLDLSLWDRITRKLRKRTNDREFYECESWEFLDNFKSEPENPQHVVSMEFITEVLRLHNESLESREFRLSNAMAGYLDHLRRLYR